VPKLELSPPVRAERVGAPGGMVLPGPLITGGVGTCAASAVDILKSEVGSRCKWDLRKTKFDSIGIDSRSVGNPSRSVTDSSPHSALLTYTANLQCGLSTIARVIVSWKPGSRGCCGPKNMAVDPKPCVPNGPTSLVSDTRNQTPDRF
jgi:hypothetical protein